MYQSDEAGCWRDMVFMVSTREDMFRCGVVGAEGRAPKVGAVAKCTC